MNSSILLLATSPLYQTSRLLRLSILTAKATLTGENWYGEDKVSQRKRLARLQEKKMRQEDYDPLRATEKILINKEGFLSKDLISRSVAEAVNKSEFNTEVNHLSFRWQAQKAMLSLINKSGNYAMIGVAFTGGVSLASPVALACLGFATLSGFAIWRKTLIEAAPGTPEFSTRIQSLCTTKEHFLGQGSTVVDRFTDGTLEQQGGTSSIGELISEIKKRGLRTFIRSVKEKSTSALRDEVDKERQKSFLEKRNGHRELAYDDIYTQRKQAIRGIFFNLGTNAINVGLSIFFYDFAKKVELATLGKALHDTKDDFLKDQIAALTTETLGVGLDLSSGDPKLSVAKHRVALSLSLLNLFHGTNKLSSLKDAATSTHGLFTAAFAAGDSLFRIKSALSSTDTPLKIPSDKTLLEAALDFSKQDFANFYGDLYRRLKKGTFNHHMYNECIRQTDLYKNLSRYPESKDFKDFKAKYLIPSDENIAEIPRPLGEIERRKLVASCLRTTVINKMLLKAGLPLSEQVVRSLTDELENVKKTLNHPLVRPASIIEAKRAIDRFFIASVTPMKALTSLVGARLLVLNGPQIGWLKFIANRASPLNLPVRKTLLSAAMTVQLGAAVSPRAPENPQLVSPIALVNFSAQKIAKSDASEDSVDSLMNIPPFGLADDSLAIQKLILVRPDGTKQGPRSTDQKPSLG